MKKGDCMKFLFTIMSIFLLLTFVSAAVDNSSSNDSAQDPIDSGDDGLVDDSESSGSTGQISTITPNNDQDYVSPWIQQEEDGGLLGYSWFAISIFAASLLLLIIIIVIIIMLVRGRKRKNMMMKHNSSPPIAPVRTGPSGVSQVPSQPTTTQPSQIQQTPPTQQVPSQQQASQPPQSPPMPQPTPQPSPTPQNQPQQSQGNMQASSQVVARPHPQQTTQSQNPHPQQQTVSPQPQAQSTSPQGHPTSVSTPAKEQGLNASGEHPVEPSRMNKSSVQYVKYYSQNLSHDPRVRIQYLLSAGTKFIDSHDTASAKQIYSYIFEDYHHLSHHDDTLYNQIVAFRRRIN